MTSPYKRRKSSNVFWSLWHRRRLVGVAMVLGLILWFILINNTAVTIAFPFGLGKIETTSGIAILLGVLAGSVATALIGTLLFTVRRYKAASARASEVDPEALPEDRPPTDYASKTGEGFSPSDWSAR